MSSAAIPYHLRPHKAVDRRLFLDLLSKCERWKSLTNHTYVSMGAYPLEDQKQIHRLLGIKKLISFDYNLKVVDRQQFNKPVVDSHCLEASSSDMISNLDKKIDECGIKNTGVIFWLDYTDPKEFKSQIREFQTLLDSLAKGDIVRLTVNAEAIALGPKYPDPRPNYMAILQEKRLRKLKQRIGDYLPSSVVAGDMTNARLPLVYCKVIAEAARQAFPSHHSRTFLPLSLVRYADGHQMLSVTGIIINRKDNDDFLKRSLLRKWPFWSRDWSHVHKLVVPSLTLRERLFLEKLVTSSTPSKIIKEIGFDEAEGISMKDFLVSYKKYYRFYPSLLALEI